MGTDPDPHRLRSSAAPAGTVYGRGAMPVGGDKPDLLSRLHPAITATIAVSFIAVLTLGYLTWRSSVTTASPVAAASASAAPAEPPADDSPEASPSPSPSVSPSGLPLTRGTWSLESVDASGSFIGRRDGLGVVETIDAAGDMSLVVTGGLADRSCFSFRTADGRYLRHYAFRLRFDAPDDSDLFRKDATFCAETGAGGDSVRLRSVNYRDRVLHHRGRELWLDRSDGSRGFSADSSFTVRAPASR